jgi:hypothetical protein
MITILYLFQKCLRWTLKRNGSDMKYWNKGNCTMPHGTSKIKVFPGEGSVNWDSAACNLNLIVVRETTGFLDKNLIGGPGLLSSR